MRKGIYLFLGLLIVACGKEKENIISLLKSRRTIHLILIMLMINIGELTAQKTQEVKKVAHENFEKKIYTNSKI